MCFGKSRVERPARLRLCHGVRTMRRTRPLLVLSAVALFVLASMPEQLVGAAEQRPIQLEDIERAPEEED